ncbi:hypothetical protein DPMN_114960 [Dreissena polymorpha]|uniref:Uncharacterized protein n=1 Tax=Dreissena polymorpha TaxID=45954 RepID=A0A9D4KL10_DREPO|nr:hypothetical protein DPMN_114960 [Dreissena polymorpha]
MTRPFWDRTERLSMQAEVLVVQQLPVDVAPVNCPRDCLVMYSVQPCTYGSWMLHFMFHNRKELKKQNGNVLTYLTSVARAMANHTYNFSIENVKKESADTMLNVKKHIK